MKEKTEEVLTNLSNIQRKFLELVEKKPQVIIESLTENDMVKALAWNDSIKNGGKLGRRAIASRYDITESKARWIIEQIEKRKNG